MELDPTRLVDGHEVGESLDRVRVVLLALTLLAENRRHLFEAKSGAEDGQSAEDVPV
jgi:hypothetical protein